MSQPEDLRASPRRPVRLPVEVEVAGKTVPMQAINISRGGIMLLSATPDFLRTGTFAKVRLQIGDGAKIEVKGLVRHSAMEKGVGVEFIDVQGDERARLAHYLENLPTSASSASQ